MVKSSSLLKENKLSLNKTYKRRKRWKFLIFWCPLIFSFSDLALEHAAFSPKIRGKDNRSPCSNSS